MRAVVLSGISFLVCFGFARWATTPAASKVSLAGRTQAFETGMKAAAPTKGAVQATVTTADRLFPLREALSGDDPLASAAAALR